MVIVGGGAAGFFTAINLAEANPDVKVVIIERSDKLLSKVKISGGGRCNVTHACWEPQELIEFYPRGKKELLGPFHTFCTGDTVGWFEDRGIDLKIEDDNRMFPVSNSSQTIIDCFLKAASKAGVEIRLKTGLQNLSRKGENWTLTTNQGTIEAHKVVFAAGSSPKVWKLLAGLGHTIAEPVPSLFTFNINDKRIKGLAGLSVPMAQVRIQGTKYEAEGPLLITHWGMSGPGILKLSAFAARDLHDINYSFKIEVNFTGLEMEDAIDELTSVKAAHPKKLISNFPCFGIPKRLWAALLTKVPNVPFNQLGVDDFQKLTEAVTKAGFWVHGKSTFKDEFVTAGGVELSEVNFKTMESKVLPGVHFAGEVLNIDAVTGGFNFQAAWTTAWIASQSCSAK